jgi:pimeloyl-[acyl-carrier protein] methyl ester esterase
MTDPADRSGRPTLILLHGWGLNARVFDPLLDAVGGEFALYPVDLPGHGKSRWRGEAFDRQVERLAAGLPAGHLLGWSMGGLYAIELAHRFPGHFGRVLLVASNPCFVQRADWSCAVAPRLFDEFAEGLVHDWQGGIRRFIGLQLQGDRGQRALIRQVTRALEAGGAPQAEALYAGLELLKTRDARQRLAELAHSGNPPKLLLGGLDRLVPPCLAEELPAIAPSIDVECWPRSAHAPFLSATDAFAAWIRRSVESAPTGQVGGQKILQSLRR